MKIKSVCEATGLSDRAIRYYIDERLVAPACTENYLGRRSFDFTEADVKALNSISMLRKYGFSVSEIRTMIQHPDRISETTQTLIARKKEHAAEEAEMIWKLESVDAANAESISALADALFVAQLPAPDKNAAIPTSKRVFRILLHILLVAHTFAPVLIGLIVLNWSFHETRFPVISPIAIVLVLVFLTPSMLMAILPRVKKNLEWKRTACIVLSFLILLSVPLVAICSIGVVSYSATHDYHHYLVLDEGLPVGLEKKFYAFFPRKFDTHFDDVIGGGERVALGEYYYRNLPALDYTYDVYAEYPVSREELDSEILRISALFEDWSSKYSVYVNTHHGAYQCLIWYYARTEPFLPVDDSYTYFIFAYNEETLRVRYILCDSLENGYDQPYYLELDWNE